MTTNRNRVITLLSLETNSTFASERIADLLADAGLIAPEPSQQLDPLADVQVGDPCPSLAASDDVLCGFEWGGDCGYSFACYRTADHIGQHIAFGLHSNVVAVRPASVRR